MNRHTPKVTRHPRPRLRGGQAPAGATLIIFGFIWISSVDARLRGHDMPPYGMDQFIKIVGIIPLPKGGGSVRAVMKEKEYKIMVVVSKNGYVVTAFPREVS